MDIPPLEAGLLFFTFISLAGNAIGSALRYPDIGSAVLFPAYAALTAALVVSRRRDWVWFLLVDFAAHLIVNWPKWSLSWVMMAGAANIVRALIAAFLLRRIFNGPSRLNSIPVLSLFILSAVLVAPAVGAMMGAAIVVHHGASTSYWHPWIAWFVSNALTGLVLLPALISAFGYAVDLERLRLNRERVIEALLLAVALCATCAFSFLGDFGRQNLAFPLYGAWPVLIWAALRFGPGGASAALTVVTFAAIWSVDRGRDPFLVTSFENNIFALQMFVLFTGLPVLCLAVISVARRQAQAEIDEQRRELTHLSRVGVLGQLSGALAHELNQPLTAILSNAETAQLILQREPLDLQALSDILKDIIADDRHAAAVIQRLRALLKRGDRRLQWVDSAELISDVLQLTHTNLITHRIVVTTAIDPALPSLWGDKVQLQQVLLNLILNACEAMSHSPASRRRLALTARSDAAGSLHLAIRDWGTGFPPEMIDRLFEPFMTTKADGLGLGLSISRTIIAAHGGRLWGENNPDGGATLHCFIPVTNPVAMHKARVAVLAEMP